MLALRLQLTCRRRNKLAPEARAPRRRFDVKILDDGIIAFFLVGEGNEALQSLSILGHEHQISGMIAGQESFPEPQALGLNIAVQVIVRQNPAIDRSPALGVEASDGLCVPRSRAAQIIGGCAVGPAVPKQQARMGYPPERQAQKVGGRRAGCLDRQKALEAPCESRAEVVFRLHAEERAGLRR